MREKTKFEVAADLLAARYEAARPAWKARKAAARVASDLADRRAAQAEAARWIERVKARKAVAS